MICVVIKGPGITDAYKQIERAVFEGADLVELYLSAFDSLDFMALKQLKDSFSIPMIFTLRDKSQGRNYLGCEEKRYSDIRALAELHPEFLDIEAHVSQAFIEEIRNTFPTIKIILSFHDFEKTPKNLDEIFAEMQKTQAFFYKVAVFATSSLDALRVLSLAMDDASNKLIAISMGKLGAPCRILSSIVGSPITYACLDLEQSTAPGQLTMHELQEKYHCSRIGQHTAIFALIGHPVDKSISDITHNYLLEKCKKDAVYIKIPLFPEELREFFFYIKKLPFKGISVTMPLKEYVLDYLDEVGSEAAFIGSVNTIVLNKTEEGSQSSFGFNTDGIGALNAIEATASVMAKKVIILGAGGAAKAIAYEACKRGANVVILNRDVKKAELLAKHLGCLFGSLEDIQEHFLLGYDVLINSTPLFDPIEHWHILPKSLVMDVKTLPKYSVFLEHARSKGCGIVFGYQMFLEQAIYQFKGWGIEGTSTQAVRDILEEKVIEVISLLAQEV